MAQKIQQFTIAMDKPAYFAGEVMQAAVTLVTTEPIECRGIRADVRGEGSSRFITGSGDNKETRTHKSTYWRETHTLWGPFHRTEEIDDAGTHAIFGSPWAPNEGVLHIPIEDASAQLIVRVMDEDYGKRDDLLGEIVVTPKKLVEQSQDGATEVILPLMRNGKTASHKGDDSILVVKAMWVDLPGLGQRLRLVCVRANHLRKADWGLLAKNDVYVQAYHPPPGSVVDTSKSLPLPDKKAVLPPGQYTFTLPPLKLPDDLPASKEAMMGFGPGNYVRYYITAKIDIAWWVDPMTRAAFSVAPRLSTDVIASTPVQLPEITKTLHPPCFCPPFCCVPEMACFELTCWERGQVKLSGAFDRLHGAPGELVSVSATASNLSETPVALNVRMVARTTLWAEGYTRTAIMPYIDYSGMTPGISGGQMWTKGTPLLRVEIPPGTENFSIQDQLIRIPLLPASYHGGYLVNEAWTQVVNQFGMRNERYWRGKRTDAMRWEYQLIIEVDVQGSKFDLTKAFPFIVCSIPKAPTITPAIVVNAVDCGAPVEAAAAEQAFQGWYNEQLPLQALSAVPVEAVLAPDQGTGLPPVAFVAEPQHPMLMGGMGMGGMGGMGGMYQYGDATGRERGIVFASTYTPMIPMATGVEMPVGATDGTSNPGAGGMTYGSNVPLCGSSMPSNQVMTGRV